MLLIFGNVHRKIGGKSDRKVLERPTQLFHEHGGDGDFSPSFI